MPLSSPSIEISRGKFTRPSKLLDNPGTTNKPISHDYRSYQGTPADGDRIFMYVVCDGDETVLDLGTEKGSFAGIFDLYINNVLDSSGYDDYAAATAAVFRRITLTESIKRGLNTIELRVNGKNASSSNYYILVYGVSVS